MLVSTLVIPNELLVNAAPVLLIMWGCLGWAFIRFSLNKILESINFVYF